MENRVEVTVQRYYDADVTWWGTVDHMLPNGDEQFNSNDRNTKEEAIKTINEYLEKRGLKVNLYREMYRDPDWGWREVEYDEPRNKVTRLTEGVNDDE